VVFDILIENIAIVSVLFKKAKTKDTITIWLCLTLLWPVRYKKLFIL